MIVTFIMFAGSLFLATFTLAHISLFSKVSKEREGWCLTITDFIACSNVSFTSRAIVEIDNTHENMLSALRVYARVESIIWLLSRSY